MSQIDTTKSGQTVVGVFDDAAAAERAINDLKVAGFMPDSISVVTKDRQTQHDLTEAAGNRASEGALAGALGGGTLGAVLGWLLAGGTALIPGIGPVVAAGIFGATVTGAIVGGAVGSISAALVGQGIPEDEAAEYEEHVRGGRTLLSVRAANGQLLQSALDIFDRNDATGVRYYNEGQTGPGRIYSRGNLDSNVATASDSDVNQADRNWTSTGTGRAPGSTLSGDLTDPASPSAMRDADNATNIDRRDYSAMHNDTSAPDYRDETYRNSTPGARDESRRDMENDTYRASSDLTDDSTTLQSGSYSDTGKNMTGTVSYSDQDITTHDRRGIYDEPADQRQHPTRPGGEDI